MPERPDIVVMAHLDEIALLVVRVEGDGRLAVTSLGGAYPWKWGEGPLQILASDGPLDGILSFGSIHTNDGGSVAAQARERALTWTDARVFTGLSVRELEGTGCPARNARRPAPVAAGLGGTGRVRFVAVSG